MTIQRNLRQVRVWLSVAALAILLVSCGQAERSIAPPEVDSNAPDLVETVGCIAQNDTGTPYTTFHIDDGYTTIDAVNEAGVMTGSAGGNIGSFRSFVLDDDRNLDVFTLSGKTAIVAAINEHGDVAGRGSFSGDSSTGFVRSRDGAMREFPLSPSGSIRSISDDGVVAGYGRAGDYVAGFTNSAETGTIAYGIDSSWDVRLEVVNDNGWSAGTADGPERQSYGFVVDPSGVSTIVEVNDVRSTIIADMNVHGDVTGYYADEDLSIERGFVRYASGEVVTFDVSGAVTVPWAINDEGEVVGTYSTSIGSDGFDLRSGFFRSASGSVTTVSIPGADFTMIRDLTNSAIAVGHTSAPASIRSSTVGFAMDFSSSCSPN